MTSELPNLLVRTVVARRHVRRCQVLCVLVALASRHLTAAAMTRHAALASGFARFLACPLVGRALLMGGLAALAGNLALLRAVHRSESAIFFSHTVLPTITLPAYVRAS